MFKNGIRTTEFFRDHDKLRSGIVTENQFKCGLSLAVGKEAQLSRAEIQKVVEYYRISDDRVQYREFCNIMENGEFFTPHNLHAIMNSRGISIDCIIEWIYLEKGNLLFVSDKC